MLRLLHQDPNIHLYLDFQCNHLYRNILMKPFAHLFLNILILRYILINHFHLQILNIHFHLYNQNILILQFHLIPSNQKILSIPSHLRFHQYQRIQNNRSNQTHLKNHQFRSNPSNLKLFSIQHYLQSKLFHRSRCILIGLCLLPTK